MFKEKVLNFAYNGHFVCFYNIRNIEMYANYRIIGEVFEMNNNKL